jgi:hypothetical protein
MKLNSISSATSTLVGSKGALDGVILQLDALAIRRECWDIDYQKSNIGQYMLLGDLYGVFMTSFVEVKNEERKALKAFLKAKLIEKGANILEETVVLTMFIRYVFNAPTKRAHVYSNVIKAAISHSIRPEHLSDWIVKEGGIEEVSRRKKPASKETMEKQKQLESMKIQIEEEIESNLSTRSKPIDISYLTGKYALVLVKPDLGKCYVGGTYSDVTEPLFEMIVTLMAKQRISNQKNELNSGDREFLDLALTANKKSTDELSLTF